MENHNFLWKQLTISMAMFNSYVKYQRVNQHNFSGVFLNQRPGKWHCEMINDHKVGNLKRRLIGDITKQNKQIQLSRVFFGCSGSIHWQHMPTRTLRNEVLPRDLPTPGICAGTLPTQRFREVFFLRCFAIVLNYFEADLRCLGSRFVFRSRGERDWRASRCRRASNEGIEAPDDVDRWCSWK